MNKIDQLSFFGFEGDAAASTPTKAAKTSQSKTTLPVATTPDLVQVGAAPPVAMNISAPSDPEAMAQTLAQHPDFRVLRRLVPHSDYGPINGQATQRVIVLDQGQMLAQGTPQEIVINPLVREAYLGG